MHKSIILYLIQLYKGCKILILKEYLHKEEKIFKIIFKE